MFGIDSLGKMILVFGGALVLLGRLAGDFVCRKGSFTLYFPLVTVVFVSVVLTFLLNLVLRLFSD